MTVAEDGTLYFGVTDLASIKCRLYALKPDGTLKWATSDIENALYGTPTVDTNGNVYFGVGYFTGTGEGGVTIDGALYKLESDGEVAWTFTDSGNMDPLYTSPIIDSNGYVYFGTGANSVDTLAVGDVYSITE